MKLGRVLLVLSAGLVSALMVAAVASGSQAQVAQKALEAPRPAGSQTKVGLVDQVACASAKNCGALGVSLYSELAGKWKASKVPVVAHTGGTDLRSLDCPAAGKCEAVALGGNSACLARERERPAVEGRRDRASVRRGARESP